MLILLIVLLLIIVNCVLICGLLRYSVVDACPHCCFSCAFCTVDYEYTYIDNYYLLYIHFNYFITRTIYH